MARPCCLLGLWRSCFALLVACQSTGQEVGVGGSAATGAAAPRKEVCEEGRGWDSPQLAAGVPVVVGDFCVDPNGAVQMSNAEQLQDMGHCKRRFGALCDAAQHAELGIRARAVHRVGNGASIQLRAFRFASSAASYATYTRWVLGDRDVVALPFRELVLRASKGGQASLAYPSAVLWLDRWVYHLRFFDDREVPGSKQQVGRVALESFLQAIAARQNAPVTQPALLALLPTAERLPLGVRYYQRDALGIAGAGRAVLGYYQRGQRRYALMISRAEDEAAAKDIERTLRRAEGARKLEDMPFGAFELKHQMRGAPLAGRWLVGRYGRSLAAVGEDAFAIQVEDSPQERKQRGLSDLAKLRLLRRVLQPSRALSPRPRR